MGIEGPIVWSPDGSYIAFVTARYGTPQNSDGADLQFFLERSPRSPDFTRPS